MGFAVEHDHNGDESKTIIPCLEGWISILPCRFNYWITSSAPLPGKNQGLSFISMQFHTSKRMQDLFKCPVPVFLPCVWLLEACSWMDSELGWSFLNESGNLKIVPPPHTKKNTDNAQILSSHCQVNFSLCQGSHRAWEHDKEMQNMLCEAHGNWVRDRFHSFDEGRVVMDQVVLHVHPSANTRLSQTNGTRAQITLKQES